MAALKILRDPLCGDAALEVPRSQWPLLVKERERFCREVLPSDCRLLLFFIDDAENADWLGYESRDEYLCALGLDPKMVPLAVRGLELTDRKIGMDQAVKLGKRGRPTKEEQENKPSIRRLNYGTTSDYTLARLDRDHPELAERVRGGELSANAAAKQAGFRKEPSAYKQIVKLLPRLSVSERDELRSML